MNILGLMSPQEYTQYETRLMEDYMEVREVGSQEWTRLMSFQDEAHDQYFKAKMLAEENARLNIVVTNLKTVVSINQQENAKLRECVEFYGEVFNWRDSGQDYGHGTIKPDDKEDLSEDDRVRLFGGKRARQVLKKLG